MHRVVRFFLTAPFLLLLGLLLAVPASAGADEDCFKSLDNLRRIDGCSELLDRPDLPDDRRALAFALRALAFSVSGQYDRALPDYDQAIRIDPGFSVALNNRAWTYYKAGRASEGLEDVERSLKLSPGSAHAFDTRAHIRQAMGRHAGALADYERAISYGGSRMVKLYQCGLQSHGLFSGEIDGLYSVPFRRALEQCAATPACDPLPADEDCRRLTS